MQAIDGTRDTITNSALCDYGFDASFASAFEGIAAPGELPGRVVELQRGRFRAVVAPPGIAGDPIAEVEALPAGRLRSAAAVDYPAVGDWLALRPAEGEGPWLATAVLPRRGAFIRKGPGDTEHDKVEAQVIAANVDLALLVMAAGHDWNPRRLERYLALAREAEALPVVVATKIDLAEDAGALRAEASRIARDLPVVLACAPEGRGLEELAALLEPGRTAVLLGSSGAGKSTLLNALAGEELARTREVRADDQRGRHTTTHREMHRLPSGVLVIDTPGLRELQLWGADESVDEAFPEIEELAAACRFRDCTHAREPGCAVRQASEEGRIDPARYASWQKLRKELAFLRYREDHFAREAEARKWKIREKAKRAAEKLGKKGS